MSLDDFIFNDPYYNWLGQRLDIGTAVYRGAREGNSSSFKVGVIRKINYERQTARVEWLAAPARRWKAKPDGGYWENYTKKLDNTFGSPGLESLIAIDPALIKEYI